MKEVNHLQPKRKKMNLLPWINKIPIGYSEGLFRNVKYGITKSLFNDGKSLKIYARELRGNDFISLNFYITRQGEVLRPCEMEEQKVLKFLKNVTIKKELKISNLRS